MGTGNKSDLQIYHEQFHSGYEERIGQNTNGFNAASNGAIVLSVGTGIGEYEKEAFIAALSNPTSRRDTTSTSAQNASKLTESEKVAVKLARKMDLIRQTMDSFRKIGMSWDEVSFRLGQMYADHKVKTMLNDAIKGAVAAISGQSDAYLDVSGNGDSNKVSHGNLNKALRKFGDRSGDVVCWVMPGTANHDLIGTSIVDNVFGIGGLTIQSGAPVLMNRPALVTDASALTVSGDDIILGLTAGGIVVKDLGTDDMLLEKVGGNENIEMQSSGRSSPRRPTPRTRRTTWSRRLNTP